MKRFYIAWLLLLCMILTACGGDGSANLLIKGESSLNLPIQGESSIDSSKPPLTLFPVEGDTKPVEEATAPATEATEAPTESVVVNQPPSEPVVVTQIPTEATTAVTTQRPGVTYNAVDPYPIPIANPGKDVYDSPGGNYLRDYNAIGYDTIVEEAKDKSGVLWGRLATGGWTMVYNQILPDLDMYFTAGAGAWGTELQLKGNGKYSGSFHDSNMGEIGENHPNGTCYVCGFSGRVKVTDIDTYAIYLERTSLTQDVKEGKEWIENGILYIGGTPYGMDGGKEFVLYTPQTPVSILPAEMSYWGSVPSYGTLGCYALYNPSTGYTFFGS